MPRDTVTMVFLLTPKPREWFKQMWDTYGFDWDTEHLGVIWPIEDQSVRGLRRQLATDGIQTETFRTSVSRWFGG